MRLLNDRVLRAVAFVTAKALELEDTYLAEYIALTKLPGGALVMDDAHTAAKVRGYVKVMRLAELPKS